MRINERINKMSNGKLLLIAFGGVIIASVLYGVLLFVLGIGILGYENSKGPTWARGIVADESTHLPLSDVYFGEQPPPRDSNGHVLGGDETDSTGAFSGSDIFSSHLALYFTKDGYQTKTVDFKGVRNGDIYDTISLRKKLLN